MKTLVKEHTFENIVEDLISNETVLQMKNYRQHFDTSCFDHCYLAAYYCYIICKKLNLDYISATRAAMLHDLFLYDWREKSTTHRLHAFHHGKIACMNACKIFDLNQKEKDIITRHMWPVTFTFPNSPEGFILTFIDKYCAIEESWQGVRTIIFSKKFFRYTYLFLCLLFFNMQQL